MPSVLVFFLVFLWAFQAAAEVKQLEIYQNGLFLTEEFVVKPGENVLPLLSAVPLKEIEISSASQGLVLGAISTRTVTRKEPIYKTLADLKTKESQLKKEIARLDKELSLLEEVLKGKREVPSPEAFLKYQEIFRDLTQQKDAKEQELEKTSQKIKEISQKIAFPEVTALEIQALNAGIVRVRYPAKRLLSWQEAYECQFNSARSELFIKGEATIKQKSGLDWRNVLVLYYPRQRARFSLSPPPFQPWIIGESFPRPELLLRKTKEIARSLIAEPKREEGPGAIWERVVTRVPLIPAGKSVLISLGKEQIPVKNFLIEVPAYATEKAYFRVDVVSQKSFPRLFARFYLDGVYVGRALLGPLYPGQQKSIYFGPAPLLAVKKEVLKDTTGENFWGKEVQVKETRLTLVNNYKKTFPVEVIDRIPISRKKEIKIKAEARPPWQEISPEGKALWRFGLVPGMRQEIYLKIEIKRPKNE